MQNISVARGAAAHGHVKSAQAGAYNTHEAVAAYACACLNAGAMPEDGVTAGHNGRALTQALPLRYFDELMPDADRISVTRFFVEPAGVSSLTMSYCRIEGRTRPQFARQLYKQTAAGFVAGRFSLETGIHDPYLHLVDDLLAVPTKG